MFKQREHPIFKGTISVLRNVHVGFSLIFLIGDVWMIALVRIQSVRTRLCIFVIVLIRLDM